MQNARPALELRACRCGASIRCEEEEAGPLAKFDLLSPDARSRTALGLAEYAADLFEAATMARLAGHLAILLAGAVAEPDRRLSAAALVDAAEGTRLTVEWAAPTPPGWTRGTAIPPVRRARRRRRSAPAVEGEDGALTYGELDRRAGPGAPPAGRRRAAGAAGGALPRAVARAWWSRSSPSSRPAAPTCRSTQPTRRAAGPAARRCGPGARPPLVLVRAAEVERFTQLLGAGWTVLALPPLDATPDGELGGEPGDEAAAVRSPLPLAGEGQGEGGSEQVQALSADAWPT